MKVVIGVLSVCAATISYLSWARHIGNIVIFSYFLGGNWCCFGSGELVVMGCFTIALYISYV